MSTTVEEDLRTPWMAAADGGRVSRNVENLLSTEREGSWRNVETKFCVAKSQC